MFGLADCNSFFVSCERVFAPFLWDKPVIVLSNNDGCVVSRSKEAVALGIRMGQPIFQIRDLVKANGVYVFSSNYVLYGDMSHRVMETLRENVPSIEAYSIDEAFLDLRGIELSELDLFGKDLAYKVKKNTGIPISVGISHTKTLAKIASKIAKKDSKLHGACFLRDETDIRNVLKTFPVSEIWGIGREYSKMLVKNNIMTAYDFLLASPQWVKEKMSIVGLRTWRELHSESCISFEESIKDKKQICVSRSFSRELSDIEELSQAVATFATRAAANLRKQNSVCYSIHVFILTNQFKEGVYPYYRSSIVTQEFPTDSTIKIVKGSIEALVKIYRKEYSYKKAGVVLMDISKKDNTPSDIFYNDEMQKHNYLMKALDDINSRFGDNTLVTATQGVNKLITFSNYLSKKYTTSWDDIIEIKI